MIRRAGGYGRLRHEPEVGPAGVVRVGIGTTNPQGNSGVSSLDVNGSIFQRGSQLHADYVFAPGYDLESIAEHAAEMWRDHHLPAVPGRYPGIVIRRARKKALRFQALQKLSRRRLGKTNQFGNALLRRDAPRLGIVIPEFGEMLVVPIRSRHGRT